MTKLYTCLIIMLLPLLAMAQNQTVSGTVTSSEDGQPLPGVNVVVQGTSRGTVTDIDGKYTLELGSGENSLVFSFVGFLSQTIAVNGQTNVDVVLAPDTQTLDEVVVIGYGTVRKSDLTGSVSSVRGEDLTRVPAVSPMQALQGKVSGVQVTSGSGAPGQAPVVRIRGTGTFGNANPIYVVDGVILDDINFLNPADIESIEILKDASATAIYGSMGANGVVMVTTKKGSKGQTAPVINFSAEYSIQKLQKQIDLLSGREFAEVVNEINPGTYNNVDAVPNTDWQNELFRTAPIQNYQFSASAASERLQYYFGIGYFRQDGIIPKSAYERATLKFNNTYHLTNRIRFGANLGFTPYKQTNTNGNAPFNAYRAQPTITPYQSDGSYSPVPGVGNVFADIEYTNNTDRAIRTVNNIYGEIDFFKGLTLKSSFSVDAEYKRNTAFTPAFFVNAQQENSVSDLTKTLDERIFILWENTISYNNDIGKHRIGAVAGYTTRQGNSENLKVVGEGILREGEDFWYINRDNVNGALTENKVNDDLNYAMISYLFRVNYTFDHRYLFTATYRRDGSSKFSKNRRYADFPSFALGWNVINESFMQGLEKLSNLKVRASWGIVGNEKINYRKQYSGVTNGWGAVFGVNETLYPGSSFGSTGNENLIWEDTYQFDAGIELGFFNDQLTAEIDYYHKTTKGILIDLPVPAFLGNGNDAKITYNAAEVVNKGLEYNLAWSSEWNGIRYRIGTIGTTIDNKATKVFGTGDADDKLFNTARTTATSPGREIGAFYGYVVDGVFQNQAELDAYPHLSQAGVGDLRFVDTNNDGVLTPDDRTYLGSAIPTFLYGINLGVGFKGFDLSVDFQGQTGNKIFNAKETVRPDLYNFEQHVYDRWRGEGTSNSEPRASAGGYNFNPSSRFIQDGSFFRLRNIMLGYKIPASIASKAKMTNARIYVSSTNLFTITKYTGYSPEVASIDPNTKATSNDVLNAGIDYGTYPVSAIYSVGLNITF